MDNKKEPLMSCKDWIVRHSKPEMTTSELMQDYANYFTKWHLNNAKEFLADETELEGDECSNFTRICINKQSIHTAIDNYIKINL